MKPPTPKSPSDRPAPPPAAAGETQVIDLQDVELLVAAAAEKLESARSLPPPLPPEVRASHVPSEPMRVSQPPQPHAPSVYPAPSQVPPPARSTAFYAVAILVVLVVGLGGGLVVARSLRKAPSPVAAPSANAAKAQATVITIPVVEMNDSPDAGK